MISDWFFSFNGSLEMESITDYVDPWVCPNDRQLALRGRWVFLTFHERQQMPYVYFPIHLSFWLITKMMFWEMGMPTCRKAASSLYLISGAAQRGGLGGCVHPSFLKDWFCNSPKSDEQIVGGGGWWTAEWTVG